MTSHPSVPSTPRSKESFWLTPHRHRFLESLEAQGYAGSSLSRFRCMTDRLCAEAEARGLKADDLDAGVLGSLAATCPTTGAAYMRLELARMARRFTAHLVETGVMDPVIPPPPAPPESLGIELDHWLRHHRGMFGGRLPNYRNILKRFLAFCAPTGSAEDLAAVTAETIFAFVEEFPGSGNWRIPYVRNILRFLFWSGRIPRDLSAAIPRARYHRPDGRPRHLDADAVGRLLEAVRGDGPHALRDTAMLLLMARLGLRAQEVIAIRLDDLDWRAGRMQVRGKGGQSDSMPLPVDVAEAMIAWLRDGRKGNSRHLFVRLRSPFTPLRSSRAIRDAFRKACRRAGLRPAAGAARTHSLRHGLAMKLLGSGASLPEIGNVLRHRGIRSTTVYARYDLEALRPLARPWPVPGGLR